MAKEKALYQVSLKVLLKNEKGETLLLKALDGGMFSGFYDLPGGRIDVDETEADIESILKREISEEIGNADFKIDPQPVSMVRRDFTDTKISVLYVIFEAEYFGGDIKISEEHSDYLWVKLGRDNIQKYIVDFLSKGIEMYFDKK